MRSRTARRGLVAAAALVGTLAAAPAAFANTASSAGAIALSVTAPSSVLSGVQTTYAVSVTNNTVSDFSFADSGGQLPVGWILNWFGVNDDCARSNSNAFGIVRGPGFSCVWAVPGSAGFVTQTLSPGQTASWTFVATAGSPGTYTAHFTAQGTFASGSGGVSNALDMTIPVAQGPATGGGGRRYHLRLTGSASNGSPALGSAFSYKFQDKNGGKVDASAVTFDDPLPASVAATSVLTDTGTCSLDAVANTVHCDLGTLAVGKQATITVTALAPKRAAR
jgi:uncharacterized repeat protein (TIGR01451 family)